MIGEGGGVGVGGMGIDCALYNEPFLNTKELAPLI